MGGRGGDLWITCGTRITGARLHARVMLLAVNEEWVLEVGAEGSVYSSYHENFAVLINSSPPITMSDSNECKINHDYHVLGTPMHTLARKCSEFCVHERQSGLPK